jgi:N-acetylglucosaminyldiphosphoundecaprenol N-acetyl-beta-D-mannosaminyltransferase
MMNEMISALVSEMNGWKIRWYALVRKTRVVRDEDDEKLLLEELATNNSPKVVGFVNSYAMNSVVNNTAFFDALCAADILLRDGSGMAMLFTRLTIKKGLNMNGTDFIPKLLESYRGRQVAFWGTQEPYLSHAVSHAQSQYGVEVVSFHHGFDPEQVYVDLAEKFKPDLIVLGMGMPKQEKIAALIRDTRIPALVVCGGAIIDFMGNKIKRAPLWVRKLGCEWVYRLALEPKRLYRRYVLGNPAFMFRLMRMHRVAQADSLD